MAAREENMNQPNVSDDLNIDNSSPQGPDGKTDAEKLWNPFRNSDGGPLWSSMESSFWDSDGSSTRSTLLASAPGSTVRTSAENSDEDEDGSSEANEVDTLDVFSFALSNDSVEDSMEQHSFQQGDLGERQDENSIMGINESGNGVPNKNPMEGSNDGPIWSPYWTSGASSSDSSIWKPVYGSYMKPFRKMKTSSVCSSLENVSACSIESPGRSSIHSTSASTQGSPVQNSFWNSSLSVSGYTAGASSTYDVSLDLEDETNTEGDVNRPCRLLEHILELSDGQISPPSRGEMSPLRSYIDSPYWTSERNDSSTSPNSSLGRNNSYFSSSSDTSPLGSTERSFYESTLSDSEITETGPIRPRLPPWHSIICSVARFLVPRRWRAPLGHITVFHIHVQLRVSNPFTRTIAILSALLFYIPAVFFCADELNL